MTDEDLLASIGWHFAIGNDSLDAAQLGQHCVRDSCPACDGTWERAGAVAAMKMYATGRGLQNHLGDCPYVADGKGGD